MVGLIPLLLVRADPLDKAFTPTDRAILAAPTRVVLKETVGGMFRPRMIGESASSPKATLRTLRGRRARAAVEAIRTGLSLPASPARCFNPRLEATVYRGSASVTMLICFECQQIRVFGPSSNRTVPFSPRAEPLFRPLLK